jgi:DNA-binding response OmpR family regulator
MARAPMERTMTDTRAPRHILVVDDDPAVRTLLRDCFELEAYRVSEAATGAEALGLLSREPFDLVTLDLKLGGEDGLDVARTIRGSRNVPIVMITGKGDPIDRVVGLELGADDYIAKPFLVREVLARVRAVLRRYEPLVGGATNSASSGVRLGFDRWMLDPGKRELYSTSGELCELTTAEFNLLEIFLRRPARVLSRDNIMDLLKGHEWSPLDRSIDTLIGRLRRKIEIDPATPRLIKTVRGVGYVLAVDVRSRS